MSSGPRRVAGAVVVLHAYLTQSYRPAATARQLLRGLRDRVTPS